MIALLLMPRWKCAPSI